MKKIILSLIAIVGISELVAQSIGLQGGFNMASQTAKSDGISISTSSKIGFLIGAVVEMPVAKALVFRPELNFIQKGGKLAIPDFVESKTTLNYLELPLNFAYQTPAGAGNLFFGAGPSIAFGLSGKETAKDLEEGGVEISQDVKFDGKDEEDDFSHLKALDFGANIMAGYKLPNGFFASIGYTFGLSNIAPGSEVTLKNNGFALKLGFIFSGKEKK